MSSRIARRLAAVAAVAAIAATAAMPAEAHRTCPEPFDLASTVPAYTNNADPSKETVAEISTVTPDGRTLIYTDAEREQLGFVGISNPADARPTGTVALPGEPTSVYATGRWILAVVDTSDDFVNTSGLLVVFDAGSRTEVARIELGGQPDSIDVNPRGTQAAIAIENERDEDLGDGGLPQAPSGYVSLVNLRGWPTSWSARPVDMSALASVDSIVEPTDLEPEYVKYSPNGRMIAVTMQENNAIALIDARRGRLVTGYSAGTVDLVGVDTVEDDVVDPSGTLLDVPREPDAIAWIGNRRLATANEGDWRGGSRGWTIFHARTGRVIWDAGTSFENLAIEAGRYPENRAENKGTEPEGIAVARYGRTTYAFVGSERANFVAVYDVSRRTPRFVQMLETSAGPEGLLPVPERGLFIVSTEVDKVKKGIRAEVEVFQLKPGCQRGVR